jgi:uncharacterized DUF497 family protein
MLLISRLLWGSWNVAHIARHEVVPAEVEEVCHGEPLAEQGKKGHIRLVGPTFQGRVLAIILEREEESSYYMVTARPASRKERRRHQQERKMGGETE